MNKNLKLSVVTSVLLSMSIFSGCGGGGGSASAVSTNIQAADGYIVDLNGTAATALCGTTTYKSNLTVGTAGKLTFPDVTLTGDCTVTVAKNAFIDSNNDGIFDPADKQVGFAMKSTGDAKYVSPLTTLVVAQKAQGKDVTALKALANNFDPVAAASTVATTTDSAEMLKIQKLMLLSEVLKSSLGAGSLTETDIREINTSAYTDDSVDIDTLDVNATLPTAIQSKTVVSKKANAIKAVVKILDKIDTSKVDVDTLVVSMSDGDQNLSTALTSSKQDGVTLDATDITTFTKAGTTSSDVDVATIDNLVKEVNDAAPKTVTLSAASVAAAQAGLKNAVVPTGVAISIGADGTISVTPSDPSVQVDKVELVDAHGYLISAAAVQTTSIVKLTDTIYLKIYMTQAVSEAAITLGSPTSLAATGSISDTALQLDTINDTNASLNVFYTTTSKLSGSTYNSVKNSLGGALDLNLTTSDTTTSDVNGSYVVAFIVKNSLGDYVSATTTAELTSSNGNLTIAIQNGTVLSLRSKIGNTFANSGITNASANYITSNASGVKNINVTNLLDKAANDSKIGKSVKKWIVDNTTATGSIDTYILINKGSKTGPSFISDTNSVNIDASQYVDGYGITKAIQIHTTFK